MIEVLGVLFVGCLLVWFGQLISKSGSAADSTQGGSRVGRWHRSEAGNWTLVEYGYRYTVFRDRYAQTESWKFCISKGENDNDPFYSSRFKTETECLRAAKLEAGQ